MPEASQGTQAWDRYAYTNNNPVRYNDPSGHWVWVAAGAAVGAAISYGIQVANNYNNGLSGTAAWTQNISGGEIVGGALMGAGAVLFAPAVVSMAGEALMGVGATVGSAEVFGAGVYTYAAAQGLENLIVGIPDSAYVCRGGSCAVSQFNNGTGVVAQPDGTLSEVSVTSAGDQSIETLSSVYPHNQVGVTTAVNIRNAGGSISPSPNLPDNPYHATVNGLTGEKLHDIFTPTIKNPNMIAK